MTASRPNLVTLLAFAHSLITAFWLFIALLAAVVWEFNSEDGTRLDDLVVIGTLSICFAIVSLVAAIGIAHQKLLGLWTAVVGLAAMTIFWISAWILDWYNGGENEKDMLLGLFLFSIVLVAHLPPPVWRAFRTAKLETPAPTI